VLVPLSTTPGPAGDQSGRRHARLALVLLPLLTGCGVLPEPDRPPVRLVFLQFNDHYILEPVDRDRGGMARIATLVRRVRAESPHTLLVLAGDTLSPSIMSAFLGDGYQMLAAARVVVGPEDGPGLTEVVVEAIEAAKVIAPRVGGRIQVAP